MNSCSVREQALAADESSVNELRVRLAQEEDEVRVRTARLQEMERIAAQKYCHHCSAEWISYHSTLVSPHADDSTETRL